MLDVRRLVLLRELSIRGTIAAVATSVNLSPSSVSEQLALFERETKTTLLRRKGRVLQLTPAALALVQSTDPILDAIEQAESALAESQNQVTGIVRVAVFQSAAVSLMPAALRLLREQHPQLRVEMVQYEPENALHETWVRDFDLVIAEQYPGHARKHWPGLDREPLLVDEMLLALPDDDAALASLPELPPGEELKTVLESGALPWVMEPEGTATRHFAEEQCRVAGFEPDVRFTSSDLQAHVQLVASGNAVALLPELMLTQRPPGVRLVHLTERANRALFTATRSASAQSAAIRTVRHTLTEAAHEISASLNRWRDI